MRRFRFLLGVGLAVGLSGCAGNHQCFLKKPSVLSQPCLASEQTAVSAKKPCFLKQLFFPPKSPCVASEQAAVPGKKPCFLKQLLKCKKCGQVTEEAPPPVWVIPQASAGIAGAAACGHVVSSEVPANSDAAPAPISAPLSAPDRVAGYFPAFNPRGGPGVVEANWPDPLGVRTPGAVGGEEVWRTSGEGPAPGLQETSALMSPSEAGAVEPPGPAPAEGGLNAEAVPTPLPDTTEGAIPALPSPPNPSPVPPLEPSRPRSVSLRLEYENAPAPAGRPSLTSVPKPPRARRVERIDAPSDLVFPASYYPADHDATAADPAGRLVPVPRDHAAGEAPKRVSILARIARRIRGAASPCDPEPGSARGEARDVAQ
jgi:hypothetical protein